MRHPGGGLFRLKRHTLVDADKRTQISSRCEKNAHDKKIYSTDNPDALRRINSCNVQKKKKKIVSAVLILHSSNCEGSFMEATLSER